MDTNMISRKDAADRAGVNVRTIDRALAAQRLTKYTDGFGRVWIDAEELDDLLAPAVASHQMSAQ